MIRVDLNFFCFELSKMKDEIALLQKTVREHLGLMQNRRNFMLAIVAAVYLPLSFAATFFGMNIDTNVNPGPEAFSNWTTSWIDASPADIQNTTKALVSAVGTSGTLNYSWKVFGVTVACLLLTLPLSLTIGAIFRSIYRGTAHYATYWRVFAVLPSLAFVFFSVAGGLFGLVPLRIIALICNLTLILYMYYRFYQALRNKERRPLWAFTMGITTIFAGVSVSPVHNGNLAMLVPWLFFAFVWKYPRLKRMWENRKHARAVDDDQIEMVAIPNTTIA